MYNISYLQIETRNWVDGSPYTYRFWYNKQTEMTSSNHIYRFVDEKEEFSPIIRHNTIRIPLGIENINNNKDIYLKPTNGTLSDSEMFCVGLSFSRHHQQEWVKIDCNQLYSRALLICERQKAKQPVRTPLRLSNVFCVNPSILLRHICVKIIFKYDDNRCLTISPKHLAASLKSYINCFVKGNESLVLKLIDKCLCYHRTNAMHITDPTYSGLNKQPYVCDCVYHNKYLCFTKVSNRKIQCPFQYINCDNNTCMHIMNWRDNIFDCNDGKDELKCFYYIAGKSNIYKRVCPKINECAWSEHLCSTGECIIWSIFCDGIQNCRDGFDENHCDTISVDSEMYFIDHSIVFLNKTCPFNWAMCNTYDGNCYSIEKQCLFERNIYGEPKSCNNTEHLRYCHPFDCPLHYKCQYSYCIPLHTVCDGIDDCPLGEDEKQCDPDSCPGLLKCKQDHICVHPQFICDNIIHCPIMLDDESYCKSVICPAKCSCLDVSIICNNNALDSSTISTSTLSLIVHNSDIDSRAFYKLRHIRNVEIYKSKMSFRLYLNGMKFLQFLNVSNNNIRVWTFDMFHYLYNLRSLDISRNYFVTLKYDFLKDLHSLIHLHMHNCNLKVIQRFAFSSNNKIQYLHIENNNIEVLGNNAFDGLESIQYFFLYKNPIRYIEMGVFDNLTNLTSIYTDDNRLFCFVNNLSYNSSIPKTCNYILKDQRLLTLIFVITLLSIVSNMYVIIHHIRTTNNNDYFILIKILLIHDLLPGIYLTLIVYIYSLPKTSFVFTSLERFTTQYCILGKFIFIYSILMSKVVLIMLSINNLLLTKFVMKRITLNRKQLLPLLVVGMIASSAYSALFVRFVRNDSLMCFPFKIIHVNIGVVVICIIWCFIQILSMLLLTCCHIVTIKIVSQNHLLMKTGNHSRMKQISALIKAIGLIIPNVYYAICSVIVIPLQLVGYTFPPSFEAVLLMMFIPYHSTLNSLLHSVSFVKLVVFFEKFTSSNRKR